MAKTWSNRPVTEYVSPAVRERNRPSNLNVFTGVLIVMSVFFISLMTYVTIKMEVNPPKEQIQGNYAQPDEDK